MMAIPSSLSTIPCNLKINSEKKWKGKIWIKRSFKIKNNQNWFERRKFD